MVNSPTVEKFIDDFRAITKRQLRSRTRSQSHIDSVVHREFPEWFKREVNPIMINPVLDAKLEERDFFLCGTSIWFSKAMVQASPFSSLEQATSFARDLWFNKLLIQSWLNVFSAHLHIDQAAKFAPGPIMLELEQFGRKYCRKFGFVFITSTDKKLPHQILEEVKVR
ncbi:hypothetical protein Ahy_B09g097720 [Arachis hypogaea]|uniref:Uncharacterized protein n=1 Tax=Arachis hypogaea TaxID=3818 RepID=A0A444XQA0_ARAHY|nr:hypothetical protein Ahy_B09g097720 [Arachis hypogaea]